MNDLPEQVRGAPPLPLMRMKQVDPESSTNQPGEIVYYWLNNERGWG